MLDPFKAALRHSIKQVRSSLNSSYQMTASKQVCNQIKSLEPYRKAKRIALYFAVNGEIDLSNIWNSAPLQGKFCYFPTLNEEQGTLFFLPATPKTQFKKNKYGIPEPDIDKNQAIPVENLDLILMPLVAFDTQCTRLGMGAGYYDKTLDQNKNGLFVGVAYEFQHVSFLQPQPWDVPLDAVITPNHIYWP